MEDIAFKLCPVCRKQAGILRGEGDRWSVTCARCGNFNISGTLNAVLQGGSVPSSDNNYLLSAWLRERQGVNRPFFAVVSSNAPYLDTDTFNELDDQLVDYSHVEKSQRLMRILESRTSHPGAHAQIDYGVDYPLIRARNESEFLYFMSALAERGLIRSQGPKWAITPSGWEYLENFGTNGTDSKQAFVAMWFDKSMEDAWDNGLSVAIRNAGFIPYRIDRQEHNDRIDAKIIVEIQRSRFLIADVTGHRQGVYFEAGFALALNKPVIWTCRKDYSEQLHFDTRQFNHIIWESPGELGERLVARIGATVRD